MMDAIASIAIGSRRGLGETAHVDTVFLWAQEIVTNGKINLSKRPTGEMLADFLTKKVDQKNMLRCMAGLSLQLGDGQTKLAVKA